MSNKKGGKPSKGDFIPLISRDYFTNVKSGRTNFEDLNYKLIIESKNIITLSESSNLLKLAFNNLKFGQTLSNKN